MQAINQQNSTAHVGKKYKPNTLWQQKKKKKKASNQQESRPKIRMSLSIRRMFYTIDETKRPVEQFHIHGIC